jgi:hypothetical protein
MIFLSVSIDTCRSGLEQQSADLSKQRRKYDSCDSHQVDEDVH